MRIFFGFLVAGVALAGAMWLHTASLDKAICRGVVPGDANAEVSCHQTVAVDSDNPFLSSRRERLFAAANRIRVEHPTRHYAWQDPLAVVLAFAGVGAGVALVASSRSTEGRSQAT